MPLRSLQGKRLAKLPNGPALLSYADKFKAAVRQAKVVLLSGSFLLPNPVLAKSMIGLEH